MTTATKVILIGSGLAAFYVFRKYADQKFAAQATTDQTTTPQASSPNPVVTVVESIKKLLPDELIPEPAPAPAPMPTQTAPAVTSTAIVSTAPLLKTTSPTVQSTTTLVEPKLATYSYPLNTLQRKTYFLDQRVLSIAGLNLR